MLQHLGAVFFTVASIDRKNKEEVPTVYLNIFTREDHPKLIGQMRFNKDESYSSAEDLIRMAFDVVNPETLDPIRSHILEDIIVGGFTWCTMDNHHLFSKKMKPYMVIHNYNEDSDFMKLINAQSVAILQQLKCESSNVDTNMYVYSADCTNPYLSMKLKEGNKF